MIAFRHLPRQVLSKLPRQVARRHVATAANNLKTSLPTNRPPFLDGKRMTQLGVVGLGLGAAQYSLGEANDFFEHKFTTTKNPIDLADFYGTEDFMELFCVFPFMVDLMMRNSEFDDEGTIHAFGLLGPHELEIHINFDEEEIDTTGDGEPDTMSWFNKRESFKDVAPAFLGGFTIWEMTQNFGYHLKDDGTCEVYHHGEKFRGFFPIRLVFQLHSYYVIWATEKYINGPVFGMEDREEDLEVLRQNIPLHVFRQFVDRLTVELEKAKDDKDNSPAKKKDIEVTLQRLRTISEDNADKPLPRLRTLRSHKTNVRSAHLIIDDKETKDTIKTAMEQIGSSTGKMHEPVAEVGKLARHTTISSRKPNLPEE